MVSWLLLSLPWVMLMAGLVLLLWGRRGQRVDDHPHCAACGYDLRCDHRTSSTVRGRHLDALPMRR